MHNWIEGPIPQYMQGRTVALECENSLRVLIVDHGMATVIASHGKSERRQGFVDGSGFVKSADYSRWAITDLEAENTILPAR